MENDPSDTADAHHVGKMMNHGQPAATPSPDALKRRARELAQIDGREPSQVTRQDLEQALAELRDTAARDYEQLPTPDGAAARDTSDPAGGPSGRTPKYLGVEENEDRRNLALQGVEEAEHDQMINARREGGNQEG